MRAFVRSQHLQPGSSTHARCTFVVTCVCMCECLVFFGADGESVRPWCERASEWFLFARTLALANATNCITLDTYRKEKSVIPRPPQIGSPPPILPFSPHRFIHFARSLAVPVSCRDSTARSHALSRFRSLRKQERKQSGAFDAVF